MLAFTRDELITPRKAAGQFTIHDESDPCSSSTSSSTQSSLGCKRNNAAIQYEAAVPLTSSKLANQQYQTVNRSPSSKKQKIDQATQPINQEHSPIDELLSHLTQQTEQMSTTCPNQTGSHIDSRLSDKLGETLVGTLSHPSEKSKENVPNLDAVELCRLKKELEAAKDKIAQMDQELSQTQITNHTLHQVLGSPIQSDFQSPDSIIPDQLVNKLHHMDARNFPGGYADDVLSDRSSVLSPRPFDKFLGPWSEDFRPGMFSSAALARQTLNHPGWNPSLGPAWSNRDSGFGGTRQPSAPQPIRAANLRIDTFENSQQYPSEINHQQFDQAYRRNNLQTCQPGSGLGSFYGGWNSYPGSMAPTPAACSPPLTPLSFQSMNMSQGPTPYQPRPIGTPLSPNAMEFSAGVMGSGGSYLNNPWNSQPGPDISSTYVAPVEPMNYRRLLDRTMSCNWKYIVDKIVCSNDQQASIFLQQKLKVATPEQKFELVEAIVAQAYPLMINRFGNFLVQRCFEHGTPEQVIAIANSIRGHTLTLSMDAFGCHVVQKAFDVVPEDYKAIMVHELLRRIPETVIHRYACHVWQKLFELRWSDSPPQIMKYVNEALRGMWHEVALGETGSLVVQNIFENCLEEDKRPCINEVLASIDIVSHGQFGNWCIQHICEHGTPPDKSRAIEHVLRFATEYSTDQFASKVVEKCLKVGGSDFMERYLEKVCEARPDRPRMPLIDIAGDQYGNYLVQFILIHANPQHRDIVANHVRKHMVSLRGSKFGSRVAMLCCNPAFATRPGPPMGLQMHNRFAPTNGMIRPSIGSQYH